MNQAAATNIAEMLPAMALQQPNAPAIYYPTGRRKNGKCVYENYTYAELDEQSNRIAAGLEAIGIRRGMRCVLMVTPSLDFFALTFAIFKVGAVPVMVDPGIGIKNLGICLAEAQPEAFIGVPKAHAARVVMGWARDSLRRYVTVGRRWFWGGHTLDQIKALGAQNPEWSMAKTDRGEVAAILFTSGSTGPSKGVVYTHGNFLAQVDAIRELYDIQPGEIDLPTFPLFALFDPALGMTTVVPQMDFTKPASVNPELLAEAIEDFGITNMFGSPALLNTVSRWTERNGKTFPTLRRIISAGAPVPSVVLTRMAATLNDDARIFTPYGATESLPVASIDHQDILGLAAERTAKGAGVCVGFPVPTISLEVIRITDEPIAVWSEDLRVPVGEIGEMVVRGDVVTSSYFGREGATEKAKIQGPDGEVMHRMGDVGYLDEDGRLWFCGRKSHRVVLDDGTTLFTVRVEAVFNQHPAVYRSALVGPTIDGVVVPLILVELEKDKQNYDRDALRKELAAAAATNPESSVVRGMHVHAAFPVDIRHNAKIGREKLTVWAAQRGSWTEFKTEKA
jgi:acyl-CoA synthetase (AMP-forming)/AMP-acid ligase II